LPIGHVQTALHSHPLLYICTVMITEPQARVLDAVRTFWRRSGRGPTYREIQSAMGYASPNAVQGHVKALRAAGQLRKDLHGARTILPVSVDEGIPIYGTIPAGVPTDSTSENGETLEINQALFGVRAGTQAFALRVRGSSMVDAGILEGDLVVLVKRTPRNHDIVAALIDDRSTLKRYVEEKGRAVLKAEGAGHPDIRPASELVIQGVMVGLLRKTMR
jgi:repressor LexA